MDVVESKVVNDGEGKWKKSKPAKATNVIDLVSVLQQSLHHHGSHRTAKTGQSKSNGKAAWLETCRAKRTRLHLADESETQPGTPKGFRLDL